MTTSAYEDLEEQLNRLYSQVSPPPTGLVSGREVMLKEAARLGSKLSARPLPDDRPVEANERRRKMNLFLAYKIVAALVAIALAFAGAGAGVVLAGDSLPGDLVHSVKLVTEDVRQLLTTDPADRAELAMEFSTERVREMTRLVDEDRVVPGTVVDRMTRQMEETMAQIAQSRPEEVPALLQWLMERTRTQQRLLEQARTMAREESQAALGRASQVMERAHQAASIGLGDPERFRKEYQHRHEGTLAPQGEPSPVNEPQRSQEEQQSRYEGTPGPHGEASPSPMEGPEQSLEQHQHQYEGTAGPHGEASPSPFGEPAQYQEQHRYEGTPGPHGEASPTPTGEPTQSQGQQHQGTPGPMGEQPASPGATGSPPHDPNQGGPDGNRR